MRVVAQLLPEFDERELAEVIDPLSAWDDGLGVLAPVTSAILLPDMTGLLFGEGAEEVPFGALLRAVAAAALTPDAAPDLDDGAVDQWRLREQATERLASSIHALGIRSLVHDINARREAGSLRGATAEDRYLDYCRRWSSEFGPALLERLPILDNQLRRLIADHRRVAAETSDRLHRDIAALRDFVGSPTGRVVSVDASGDTHVGGRAVGVVTFDDGARVVYKPRTIDGEAGWERLAASLSSGSPFELAAARTLSRDGYGYIEFVEQTPADPAALARACGVLGAILYAVNACDMHAENILLSAAGPMPVDLETVLHPRRHSDPSHAVVPDNAHQLLAQSIYGVGILPMVIARGDGEGGYIDIGFLGEGGGGDAPFKTMHVIGGFRDDLVTALIALPASTMQSTRPFTVRDDDVRGYADRFRAGFTEAYDWVLRHRDAFAGLVEDAFAGAELRYLHNPTFVYSQLLQMAAGASVIADPAAFLSVLKRIGIVSRASSPALVANEVAQLSERDVPYFVVRVDEADIRDGRGIPTGARLPATPFDEFRAGLRRMGETDLRRQLAMIGSAFTAQFPDNELPLPAASEVRSSARGARSSLHDVLREIGDGLAESVLPDAEPSMPWTWVGPIASVVRERPWPPGVLQFDLYSGRIGPALALAASAELTGDRRHAQAAARVFSPFVQTLGDLAPDGGSHREVSLAAFAGFTGVAYAMSEAGTMLDSDEWREAARHAARRLATQFARHPLESADVIAGSMGTLAMLRHILDGEENHDLDLATERELSRILDPESREADGIWAHSGFAHGVSGALFSLARWAPESPRRTAALTTLLDRLEDFFRPSEAHWVSNLRGGDNAATGWCHGDAGIALALVAVERWAPAHDVGESASLAVDNAFASGFGRNLTLCHGDLGNRDILDWIARTTGDASIGRRVEEKDASLTAEVIRGRLRAYTHSRYAHTNSMMTGSSGVASAIARRIGGGSSTSPLILGGAR
ncbi:type 2 lanthipeptide synthetase LanM [Microbacterium sp.]|uniref:type 2 lanthipeptide synthetase LanM n=1 Tax=Microbacterium sp. TaxID=51671 RepID=UPI00333F20E0